MAAAAAVSEKLRIGCRVFCIDYHAPAVLAKEAATLDLLSDGRLEMGIGAGWSEVEYAAMGLDFEPPGRRIAKLAEVVSFIKAHWQGDELNWSGEFVRVHGYGGRPRPVQHPHPPIMIGGGGPRVLSLAGRESPGDECWVPSVERPRIHGESNLRPMRDGWRVLRTILREWEYRPRSALIEPTAAVEMVGAEVEIVRADGYPGP